MSLTKRVVLFFPLYLLCILTVPSPPEDLLAEILSPNSVKLLWGPPREQNGIITYYIIYYNSEKDVSANDWTAVKKNGVWSSIFSEITFNINTYTVIEL